MDLNKVTQKSQESIADAQKKAISYGHSDVDVILQTSVKTESILLPRQLIELRLYGTRLDNLHLIANGLL